MLHRLPLQILFFSDLAVHERGVGGSLAAAIFQKHTVFLLLFGF